MPPLARRAVRALFGPALDLPDDVKGRELIARMAKQLHLFAPVHAVLFAALGLVLMRRFPISADCEPRIASLAQLTLLALYEILGVPLLTLAAAFLVRRRFRDPYTAHSARISLVLLTTVFAGIIWSAAASYRSQNARLRHFGVEVLRCAYDGTPPAER